MMPTAPLLSTMMCSNVLMIHPTIAFSSEVGTASREENASNHRTPLLIPSEAERLLSAAGRDGRAAAGNVPAVQIHRKE
jgi:hypothetical protein